MAQVISNSGHEDMIHDAVLDYYGRRLATCSSDKTIKIFEVENETHRLTDTLKGHESAIWCISWAHPKYGTILASSSYDGQVMIWRENPQQPPTSTATNPAAGSATWSRIMTVGGLHGASVNLVAWAPHDLGCLLACASSDGYVSVLEFKESAVGGPSQAQAAMQAGAAEPYEKTLFHAHGIGCNAVSWAPAVLPGILEKSAAGTAVQNPAQQVRRLVTCGSDCLVRVWEAQPPFTAYECVVTLKGHTNWVRDVSWSPTALSRTYIASASQDGTVRIWSLGADGDMSKTAEEGAEGDGSGWQCSVIHIDVVAWRASWSLSGNVLAVSAEDNKVSLWRERLRDGGWECIRTIEE